MLGIYETKSLEEKSKTKGWKLHKPFGREKSSSSEKFFFEGLPKEIQIYILSLLPPSQSRKASFVCKLWREYINSIAKSKNWCKTPLQPYHSLHNFRFVIVGAGFSGRLSFARRFVDGTFTEKYDPVIEETFQKKEEVDGFIVSIELIVTAGQEEYSALRHHYLNQAEGVFVVYCISSRLSFSIAQKICEEMVFRNIPVIVIGSKVDLKHREVSSEEGQKLANTYSCCRKNFFEVSSKENFCIKEPFHEMVRQVAERSCSFVPKRTFLKTFSNLSSRPISSFVKLFRKRKPF